MSYGNSAISEYFRKYKTVSFILAIFIVVRHSLNYDIYSITNNDAVYWIQRFFFNLTGFAVVTFAIFSGINFYRNVDELPLLFTKLRKRLFTLVIPYVIAVTINWFIFAILKYLPYIKDKINGSLYDLTLHSYIISLLTGGGTPLWFLRNLIIFTFLAPAFYFILKNKYISIAFWALVTVVWAFNPTDQFSIPYFFIAYFLGAIIGKFFFERMLYSNHSGIIAVGVLFVVLITNTIFKYINTDPIRLFFCIICCFLFWNIVTGSTHVEKNISNDFSFFLYCYHYFLVDSVKKVILILMGDNSIGALMNFIMCPLLTVLLLRLIDKLIVNRYPLIKRLVCGSR